MTLTPPPFDPEIAAALAVMGDQVPTTFTPEVITALRQGSALAMPSDEDLRAGGAFEVGERLVPGPQGEPDISLLVCRPTGVAGADYYVGAGQAVCAYS